jgi:hypothetical protein
MKLKLILYGLFSFSTLLPLMPGIIKIARAGCVAIDVAPQVAVSSSDASVQQSTTEANFSPNCFGSVSSVTDTQVGISNGPINQTRQSEHNLGNSEENPYGLSGPNIFVPVNPQVNTTIPSFESNFIPGIDY